VPRWPFIRESSRSSWACRASPRLRAHSRSMRRATRRHPPRLPIASLSCLFPAGCSSAHASAMRFRREGSAGTPRTRAAPSATWRPRSCPWASTPGTVSRRTSTSEATPSGRRGRHPTRRAVPACSPACRASGKTPSYAARRASISRLTRRSAAGSPSARAGRSPRSRSPWARARPRRRVTGPILPDVQLGFDIRQGATAVGFYFGVSLAMYLTQGVDPSSTPVATWFDEHAVHSWITLGMRGSYGPW
jgi:hypothetical protein